MLRLHVRPGLHKDVEFGSTLEAVHGLLANNYVT
jgi:hypothetical protein